nr:iron ABC transporter permease [Faecalibaculum rodentium]
MKQRNWRLYAFLVLSVIAVLVTAVLSVFLGSTDISWQTVLQALFAPDMSSHQQIAVVDLRLPRTLGDILVGAGLAVSGAITRNPLADSGLLGINAGASFALALCLAFLTHVSFGFTILASFAGAAVSMLAVFGILLLRHRNLDSARLVLAGLAVSLFLTALTQGIAILTSTGQSLTFWTAGGVAGIRMEQLRVAAPVMILALAGSVLLSSKLSILSLGDEAAQGLGLDLNRTKSAALILVLLLSGSAVALAGPVSFVGLLVPHVVRHVVGSTYQAIIPASMTAGSVFMLVADLVSRTVNAPAETPVGLIFAVIGVPVFIAISRRGIRHEEV